MSGPNPVSTPEGPCRSCDAYRTATASLVVDSVLRRPDMFTCAQGTLAGLRSNLPGPEGLQLSSEVTNMMVAMQLPTPPLPVMASEDPVSGPSLLSPPRTAPPVPLPVALAGGSPSGAIRTGEVPGQPPDDAGEMDLGTGQTGP